jgi:signal transduction histidine kinase
MSLFKRTPAKPAADGLAAIPDALPSAVAVLRPDDGALLYANARFAELIGVPEDRIIGKTLGELLGAPGAHRVVLAAADGTGEEQIGGGPRRLTVSARPVAFGGEPAALLAVFADPTSERAATQAEFARFPEMNPGPVLRLGLDATVVLANAAARDVFGGSLVGRPWPELCPNVAGQFWTDVLAVDGPLSLEARIDGRDYVFAHRRDPVSRLVFVFGADVTAQKQAEHALRQSEKMATLGTLAAGVAHELNNPAAATRRAAEQLSAAFAGVEAAQVRLAGASAAGWEVLREYEDRARAHAGRPADLGTVERSDREAAVEDWLDALDVPDPWDLAPPLVAQGLDPDALARLPDVFNAELLPAALAWLADVFRVHGLAHEIGQGSARISEIVGALKSYSYLGQAPVQAVDVHEGLDNTLVILRSKLKVGIEVHREYGADVPLIEAWGGELNQVWTNLLDNAADAMGGKGEITIGTRREGDTVVVDISDNGPGIPEEIQSKVFDPFFTTKAPGKGTGLGLSTSYSIITGKHNGAIALESRPGFTRFTVRLPIAPTVPAPTPVDDGEPPA